MYLNAGKLGVRAYFMNSSQINGRHCLIVQLKRTHLIRQFTNQANGKTATHISKFIIYFFSEIQFSIEWIGCFTTGAQSHTKKSHFWTFQIKNCVPIDLYSMIFECNFKAAQHLHFQIRDNRLFDILNDLIGNSISDQIECLSPIFNFISFFANIFMFCTSHHAFVTNIVSIAFEFFSLEFSCIRSFLTLYFPLHNVQPSFICFHRIFLSVLNQIQYNVAIVLHLKSTVGIKSWILGKVDFTL